MSLILMVSLRVKINISAVMEQPPMTTVATVAVSCGAYDVYSDRDNNLIWNSLGTSFCRSSSEVLVLTNGYMTWSRNRGRNGLCATKL